MMAVTIPAPQLKHQWILRYKLHHLPFWFGYHFMWWTLRIGSPAAVISSLALPHVAAKFLFFMILQMIGAYFNLYFLIPKFLERGKYIKYVVLLLLTISLTAVMITSGYYLTAFFSEKSFEELYHMNSENYYSLFESGALPSTAAAMTLAMSIKLAKNWIQSRRRQQQLEKEKQETELKFLKSQMNPHFLFNTINSIFVLIHKNPMMASESLAKFSDLLRYQLYECNAQQIPLSQELVYLENYIELQALRQDHDLVELKIHIDPYAQRNFSIAPFVLIPFIENAFKHVSRRNDHRNWISIGLRFNNDQLKLSIINSISATHHSSTEAVTHSGIGLKNVQRRLDLIYPDNYNLNIKQTEEEYEVNLQLTLLEERVHEQIEITA